MSMRRLKLLRLSVVTGVLSACNPLAGKLDTTTVESGYMPGLPDSATQKAPTAEDLSLTTNKNVASSTHLPATDANPRDTLTFAIVALPTKGTVTLSDAATGAMTYTPNFNQIGTDSFTFKASDGKLESNTATVTIIINDTYAAPVAANISPSAFSEDTQSGAIVLSYSDPDGDLATACAISNAQNVSVTQSCACNGAGVCTVKVTGSANFHGAASFDYSVTAVSQTSNVATATLAISAVDDAPTTANITPSGFNEDAQSGLITLSYTAAGGDLGTTCTISNLSNVTVTQSCACSGAGTCTLKVTGTANYYGAASFDYTVSAGSATSNTSSATLSIAQLGDDALTANAYGFDTGDHANYDFADGNGLSSTILGSVLSFASNLVKLIKADQTDNSAYGFGAGHGESFTGGAQYDSSTGREYVRLSTTSPNLELDASWTPAWPNLVGYWKLDGTVGSIAAGSTISAGVGPSGTFSNANNSTSPTTGYAIGKVGRSITFDGVDDAIDLGNISTFDYGTTASFTVSSWIKWTATPSGNLRIFSTGPTAWSNGIALLASGSGDTGGGANYGVIFYIGGAGAIANGVGFKSNRALNDGAWHMVSVTVDQTAKIASFYVDGSPSAITKYVGTCSAAGANNHILSFAGCSSYNADHSDRTTIGSHTSGINWAGSLDDVAVWNTALTGTAVQTIYQHQMAKFSGTLTSRPKDALSSGQSWTSLAWTPTLPFYKPLPDAGQSESQTNYPSQSNSLMNNLVALWHLDEPSGTSGAASVIDKSGNVTPTNGTPTAIAFGQQGKFNSAALFDGSTSKIDFGHPTALQFSGAFSLSGWFRSTDNRGVGGIVKQGSNNTVSGFKLIFNYGSQTSFQVNHANGNLAYAAYSTSYTDGWHHVAATFDGNATVNLYVDGRFRATSTAAGSIDYSTTTNLLLGAGGGYGSLAGQIDEVGIWNRALTDGTGGTPNEILELYRRGANRILYQAKSCADSSCVCKNIAAVTGTANDCDGNGVANASDSNDANLAQWLGPDGTNQSYFSELNNTDTYNTSSSTTTGAVLPTLPSLSFAKFGAPLTTHLSNNRYFQYRAIMESDDANNLCDYGGGAGTAPCSPELKVVGVGPDHYSKDKPYLIGKNPVAFYNLSGFTEALSITPGCAGGVKYQLSTNKTTWKWWDGDSWETTTDVTTAEANTQAQLNTAGVVSTFGSAVGRGSVYFRAFLGSNGQQPCELDTVTFSGAK